MREFIRKTFKHFKDRVRPNPSHPSQTPKNVLKLFFYATLCFAGTIIINFSILETLSNEFLAYGTAFVYFLASFYLFEKKSKEVDNPHECDYCYREEGRKNLTRTIMEISNEFKVVYLCDDCYTKNAEQGSVYTRDDIKLKPLTWSFESKVD
jgi:hypothetical protein